jgi:uncharacterized integral membrane protein (TIGR00697 family)
MMKHKFLLPITGLFTATLLIANTLDTKIFNFFGLDLPAGIILFPLAYLAADVLTEVYGYAICRRVIWSGFVALIVMVISYEVARALPPASFWTNQAAFDLVLAQIPRIVAGSIVAYVCGEFTNSYIVAKMKVWMNGRAMALRFVLSTIFGQLVDTVVFVAIAFTGLYAFGSLVAIAFSAWLVKVGWEIIALPVTLPIVRSLKRLEVEDFYDRETDFNPFHM